MTEALDNVVPLWPGSSFLRDTFSPPPLPPLLELRKTMGLTFDEARGILHISAESLIVKEVEFLPIPAPFDLRTVRNRYLYFLSQYMNVRERNIIRYHLTLKAIRVVTFGFDLATMGSFYGGYTARAWHNFEMNETVLPRDILKQIDQDEHDWHTGNFDQA